MSPKKSGGKYVLTGRSATMTFRIPGEGDKEDNVLVLERGVATDVPSEFVEQIEATDEVYPEGSVPEDAVVGPVLPDAPVPQAPADEPQVPPAAPAENEPSPEQA